MTTNNILSLLFPFPILYYIVTIFISFWWHNLYYFCVYAFSVWILFPLIHHQIITHTSIISFFHQFNYFQKQSQKHLENNFVIKTITCGNSTKTIKYIPVNDPVERKRLREYYYQNRSELDPRELDFIEAQLGITIIRKSDIHIERELDEPVIKDGVRMY